MKGMMKNLKTLVITGILGLSASCLALTDQQESTLTQTGARLAYLINHRSLPTTEDFNKYNNAIRLMQTLADRGESPDNNLLLQRVQGHLVRFAALHGGGTAVDHESPAASPRNSRPASPTASPRNSRPASPVAGQDGGGGASAPRARANSGARAARTTPTPQNLQQIFQALLNYSRHSDPAYLQTRPDILTKRIQGINAKINSFQNMSFITLADTLFKFSHKKSSGIKNDKVLNNHMMKRRNLAYLIKGVQNNKNPQLRVAGIIFQAFTSQNSVSKGIEEAYKLLDFNQINERGIPKNSKAAQLCKLGSCLLDYKKSTTASSLGLKRDLSGTNLIYNPAPEQAIVRNIQAEISGIENRIAELRANPVTDKVGHKAKRRNLRWLVEVINGDYQVTTIGLRKTNQEYKQETLDHLKEILTEGRTSIEAAYALLDFNSRGYKNSANRFYEVDDAEILFKLGLNGHGMNYLRANRAFD